MDFWDGFVTGLPFLLLFALLYRFVYVTGREKVKRERIARAHALRQAMSDERILQRREERLIEFRTTQEYQNLRREIENTVRTPEHERTAPTAPSGSPQILNSPTIGWVYCAVPITMPGTNADIKEDKPPTYDDCLTDLKLKG